MILGDLPVGSRFQFRTDVPPPAPWWHTRCGCVRQVLAIVPPDPDSADQEIYAKVTRCPLHDHEPRNDESMHMSVRRQVQAVLTEALRRVEDQ